MRIGNVILDTDNMTLSEINQLVNELREIRKRKEQAHDCKLRMKNAVEESKDRGFRYINRYTGAIFNADDWCVYDEAQDCTHSEEVDK